LGDPRDWNGLELGLYLFYHCQEFSLAIAALGGELRHLPRIEIVPDVLLDGAVRNLIKVTKLALQGADHFVL
jgi:hypothetical protein